MSTELIVKHIPEDIDIKKFSSVLNNPSQCYKFYWLEAILQLMRDTGNTVFRFEDIIDRMIANAWYTVTMYHLHLGPGRIDNANSDNVEAAVIALKSAAPGLSETAGKDEIIQAIHVYDKELYYSKNELTKNVPYRLLSPFIKLKNKDWYNINLVIDEIEKTNQRIALPYVIVRSDKKALNNTIIIDSAWAEWFLLEYPLIIDWINYNKVVFLQGRNPEVPGIIYKLEPPGVRKLNDVKKLWKTVLEVENVIDIYTRKPLNEENYDIDHFVPWSYVAMDEIWDLIPAEKSFNTSKNNRLPEWNTYSRDYLDSQYLLYKHIFNYEEIHELFRKCQRHNLNSRWAIDQLYIPGHDEHQFKGILEPNLRRVYDAAVIQGFSTWSGREVITDHTL